MVVLAAYDFEVNHVVEHHLAFLSLENQYVPVVVVQHVVDVEHLDDLDVLVGVEALIAFQDDSEVEVHLDDFVVDLEDLLGVLVEEEGPLNVQDALDEVVVLDVGNDPVVVAHQDGLVVEDR